MLITFFICLISKLNLHQFICDLAKDKKSPKIWKSPVPLQSPSVSVECGGGGSAGWCRQLLGCCHWFHFPADTRSPQHHCPVPTLWEHRSKRSETLSKIVDLWKLRLNPLSNVFLSTSCVYFSNSYFYHNSDTQNNSTWRIQTICSAKILSAWVKYSAISNFFTKYIVEIIFR